jgi:hypothetical protein
MSEGRFVKNKSSVALFLVGKSTICCRPISSTNVKKELFTKKTQSVKDYANYKHLKNVVHSTCVKRYNEYVNDIIMDENHKPKRLWSLWHRSLCTPS